MLPLGISGIERAGVTNGAAAGLSNISQGMGILGEIKGKGALLGVLKEVKETYPGKGKKRIII